MIITFEVEPMKQKRNFSPKRQAILQALCSTKEHPTVEWVCEQVMERYPNISLATVYRNIAQLKEDGLVITVGVVDGHERLDSTTRPHPHFICRNCGAVIDVDVSVSGEEMCKSVSNQYGVNLDHFDITFWGNCTDCQKN